MSSLLALARGATFRHGVHPDQLKQLTAGLAIERMPFVERYVLPLSQHTGAPSRPLVAAGTRVRRGEMIAAPDGFISTALHAPVSGTVTAIERRPHPNGKRMPAMVIDIDPFANQRWQGERFAGWEDLPGEEIVRRVQEAGVVGLGGAAFPSHAKLRLPEGKQAQFVVLNGCECEPYLTCDHRVMLERAADVVRGLRVIMRVIGAARGYIGVERNKADAIAALEREAAGRDEIRVVALEVKYPQGAEKMLIDAIFHREVPSGRLPLDLEIVVQNVGTAVSLVDLFERGQPLIERVVTVTGTAVGRAANLLVPIGTSMRDVLQHCGGLHPDTHQVILGGPMMGQSQKDLAAPILKGSSGLLAMREPFDMVEEQPCIRCGRCLTACPMFLNPSRLSLLARNDDADELDEHHVLDCFECASCSFVCPSNIPLVHWMRVGKALVRGKS